MAARIESILALLRIKLTFSALNLSERAAREPRAIETQIADAVFNSLQAYDKATVFVNEEVDELYETSYQEEDYIPIYDDHGEGRDFFSYEYICKVLEYVDAHPNQKKTKNASYLTRFREYKERMGTWRDRLIQVAKYCKESFEFARANLFAVHDDDIRKWALHKARELQLTRFTASPRWVQNFKSSYRVSSRRVTKHTTYRNERRQEEIEDSAIELVLDYIDTVKTSYDPPAIFNTDQSGFNYFAHSNRTLSHTGEKSTVVAVQSANALTHSYTIQPLLNMDGHLVGRLFVNLQEASGKFGPLIAESVKKYTNLFVTCTKSGKLNKELMRTWSQEVFKEVLDRRHIDRCVLYLDSWGGQRDESLFQMDEKEVNLKVFPASTTSLLQPLDLYCFRMWKDFAKRLSRACTMHGYRVERRDDILRLQSLVYNQFQHEDFRSMWLCGWRMAGFEVPSVPFPSLGETLFHVNDTCDAADCQNISFIRCIYCKKTLCVKCFFIDYHVH